MFAKEGAYPGVTSPVVPGHEIARVIEALAHSLGARHYIDSTAGDPAEALQELGGADASSPRSRRPPL